MKMHVLSSAAAFAVLLGSTSMAIAGEVRLESDTWDHIPVVEFCTGLNAPQQCVRYDTVYDVNRGYVYSAQDKVCYRRSSDPHNANSVLNNWTCANQVTSGAYTYSLN